MTTAKYVLHKPSSKFLLVEYGILQIRAKESEIPLKIGIRNQGIWNPQYCHMFQDKYGFGLQSVYTGIGCKVSRECGSRNRESYACFQ